MPKRRLFIAMPVGLAGMAASLRAKDSPAPAHLQPGELPQGNRSDSVFAQRAVSSSGSSGPGITEAFDRTVSYPSGSVGWELHQQWVNARSFPFGAKGNGKTDDTKSIQAAIDFLQTTGYGGTVSLPAGTFLISSEIILSRGVTLRGVSKDRTILRLAGNHGAIAQQLLASGTVGAHNVAVFDLQILGSGDATHTSQHGIICSSSLQYSTFERIQINKVGGNAIHAPVSPLGAIFNSFRDIEINSPRGYGGYFCGNFGQNMFERVRIFGGYSHGFVFDGTNNAGSNPLANTFIGCAYESTSNTAADVYGVYFLSNTLYNAYNTTFINCYMEPFGRTLGDLCGYYIGAAKGLNIIGGIISFAHWGVRAVSRFSEGIYVQGVIFAMSPTWGGSAKLDGKAMLSCQNSAAAIHVGPQCSAQVTGKNVVWTTMDTESKGRIHGYLNFQTKAASGKEFTFSPPMGALANRPAASASTAGQMFHSLGVAGQADGLYLCSKRSDGVYDWCAVLPDYRSTVAFPGTVVDARATQSLILPAPGAELGCFVELAPLVDLVGLTMTVACSSPGKVRVTLSNATSRNVTLAAGSWPYTIRT